MQQGSSPAPPSHDLAFVPFSWEEKPGVPKQHDSDNTLLVSIHIPPPYPVPILSSAPLSKPPRLEPHYGAALRKTTSFSTIPSSTLPARQSSALLVRKQSFDSVIYGDGGYRKPLTRGNSHGSLIPVQQKRILRGRMEDDPFLMAIQACRKEPIRVIYHGDRGARACVEEERADRRRRMNGDHNKKASMGEEGFQHLTIRQLFTQQLEEDDGLHRAQKQPLIVKKKQSTGPFTFLARCLGCY